MPPQTWIKFRCRYCGKEREAIVGSFAYLHQICPPTRCLDKRTEKFWREYEWRA